MFIFSRKKNIDVYLKDVLSKNSCKFIKYCFDNKLQEHIFIAATYPNYNSFFITLGKLFKEDLGISPVKPSSLNIFIKCNYEHFVYIYSFFVDLKVLNVRLDFKNGGSIFAKGYPRMTYQIFGGMKEIVIGIKP